jgi:hypothetical protein
MLPPKIARTFLKSASSAWSKAAWRSAGTSSPAFWSRRTLSPSWTACASFSGSSAAEVASV